MNFGDLKCECCGVPGSVEVMHRANEKGVPGRWRCAPCLGRPVDSTLLAVTDAVQLGVDPRTLDGVQVVE